MDQEIIPLLVSGERNLQAIGIGLAFAGFVAALVRQARLARQAPSSLPAPEIDRAPYFFLSTLLYLVLALSKVLWVGMLDAVAGGFLWAVAFVHAIIIVMTGYAGGALSAWRSRSAFGTARWALLGFVPVANLVLLLARPQHASNRQDSDAHERASPPPGRIDMPRFCKGPAGVFLGAIVVILGAGISVALDRQLEQKASSPAELRKLAERGDLDDVLVLFAASAQQALPIEMDDVSTMTAIELDGRTISREIVVAISDFELTAGVRDFLDRIICNDVVGSALIERGAVYEDSYFTTDGRKVGSHRVDRDVCALAPTT